ncbi:MAG TPA: glycosyltransferase [Tepidisphaeraceae bacterium]|nr:glycosyltransferase [Tepidisphaeraceae bacterium]
MRVLHIISGIDPRGGGPAVALAGLAQAQKAAGLDVSVVSGWCAGENNTITESMAQAGINVRLVGPTTGRLGRHPKMVLTLAEEIPRADILHIHAIWLEIQHQASRLARKYDKPYVLRPCGMLDPWSLAQGKLKKRIYMIWRQRKDLNRACALHFTSELERDLTGPLGLSPPAIVEPNGVDLREFELLPEENTFRRQHDLPLDRPMLLHLGRLHAKKGFDVLIPAFAQTADLGAMLVIAGPNSDGYRTTIEQMIASHRVGDRVKFVGMLRGVERVAALADADLFVLPSYQENFGVAVVESLAAGTPVIISDQVNIHPQITANGLGGVVPMSVDALAAELRRWITDTPLRGEAAARARLFAPREYDWNVIARRWTEHYRRIIP